MLTAAEWQHALQPVYCASVHNQLPLSKLGKLSLLLDATLRVYRCFYKLCRPLLAPVNIKKDFRDMSLSWMYPLQHARDVRAAIRASRDIGVAAEAFEEQ